MPEESLEEKPADGAQGWSQGGMFWVSPHVGDLQSCDYVNHTGVFIKLGGKMAQLKHIKQKKTSKFHYTLPFSLYFYLFLRVPSQDPYSRDRRTSRSPFHVGKERAHRAFFFFYRGWKENSSKPSS